MKASPNISGGRLGTFINSRQFILIALSVVLLCVIALVYFSNVAVSKIIIQRIIVEGTNIVPNSEIIDLVEHYVIKKNKNEIKIQQIKKIVESNEFIIFSDVYYPKQDELVIKVIERKPLAIIRSKNGDLNYIDERGKILPYAYHSKVIGLPIISGIDKNNFLDSVLAIYSANLVREIAQKDSDFLYLVSEINYDSKSKSFDFLFTEPELKVKFGRLENSEKKILKFNKYWKHLQSNTNLTDYTYVDIRWSNQIIIKN